MSEIAKENQSATAAKKGGSKLIIIAVLAVVLLGGAGGGFYYWRASSVAAAENTDKNAKKSRSKKEPVETSKDEDDTKTDKNSNKSDKSEASSLKDALPDDEGVTNVIELQPFIINLADTEQARYLRMTVSLGIGGEKDAKEKPDQLFITRVRNAMLAVLSNKKSDEVLSVDGKTKLRKELLKAAQAAADEPEVHAVYITDFIVQL